MFMIIARDGTGHDAVADHATTKEEAIDKIAKLLHVNGGDRCTQRGGSFEHARPWMTFGFIETTS